MRRRSRVSQFSPQDAFDLTKEGAVILDIRPPWVFATGHPTSAVNIMFSEEELAYRLQQVVHSSAPVMVLGDNDAQIRRTQQILQRIEGLSVLGCVHGGYQAWVEAGLPTARIAEMTIHALHQWQEQGDALAVVDVREDQEWRLGHVPNAVHIPLHELHERYVEVPADRPVAVICAAGNRSSTAASVLRRHGLREVHNVLEGTSGWQHAGYPLEVPEEDSPA